jgi:pyrroline-5-carboxylate reductase
MIGFIGGGNMAEALVKGMTSRGMKDIIVSEPKEERRKHLQKAYRVNTTQSNNELVSLCSIIIIAVKPQNIDDVLNEIAGAINDSKTVVSTLLLFRRVCLLLHYVDAPMATKLK